MIADSRSDIEAARLLTLSCAAAIDEHGAIKARDKIAMIKVSVPNLAFKVIDRAMQVSRSFKFQYKFLRKQIKVGIYCTTVKVTSTVTVIVTCTGTRYR
jgi:hypothetical protein